jgi:hypothetical protein
MTALSILVRLSRLPSLSPPPRGWHSRSLAHDDGDVWDQNNVFGLINQALTMLPIDEQTKSELKAYISTASKALKGTRALMRADLLVHLLGVILTSMRVGSRTRDGSDRQRDRSQDAQPDREGLHRGSLLGLGSRQGTLFQGARRSLLKLLTSRMRRPPLRR